MCFTFLWFRHGSLFPPLRNGLIAFECNVIITKSTYLTPHFRKALSLHQNGLPTDWQELESLFQQTEDQLFKNKSKPLFLSISVASYVDCLFMCFDFFFCRCWSTVLCSCRVAKETSQSDQSRHSLSVTLPSPKNFTAGTETLLRGWVQWPPWLSTHPILTWSAQIINPLPDRPHISKVRVSNILFHKAIYSPCSNTETATTGASEEGPQQSKPWAFIALV